MRAIMVAGLTGLTLLGAAAPAHASSDGTWREFTARVTRACVAASGYRDARPSAIVGFDDRVGAVAMLVSDRRSHTAAGKLCLYDKRARRAYVDDAEGWSAPPQPR